jgi:predicted PurR-regulated permease PerM
MAQPPLGDRAFARRVLIASAIFVGVLVFLIFLRELVHILLVFFAGVLFAIMLDALSGFGQRYLRLPHGWALFLVCLLLVGLITGAIWFIGPQVGQQLVELGQRLPEAAEQAAGWLKQYDWLGSLMDRLPEPEQALDAQVLGRLPYIFSTAFGIVFYTVVIIFVGLYLAMNPRMYMSVVLRLVPPRGRPRGQLMLETVAYAMKRWLVGRLVTMVFIGVGTTLALWVVGMPLPFSLGLIAGVLNFIPYLGPLLSAVPAVLIAFAVGPQMVLYVLLIYIAVQSVESYVVDPLVERRSVYIPPGFQIPIQLMAGVLAGFMGLLLATPLVVVATVAAQMLYLEGVLGEHSRVIGSR